jgi:hypothetical protein
MRGPRAFQRVSVAPDPRRTLSALQSVSRPFPHAVACLPLSGTSSVLMKFYSHPSLYWSSFSGVPSSVRVLLPPPIVF